MSFWADEAAGEGVCSGGVRGERGSATLRVSQQRGRKGGKGSKGCQVGRARSGQSDAGVTLLDGLRDGPGKGVAATAPSAAPPVGAAILQGASAPAGAAVHAAAREGGGDRVRGGVHSVSEVEVAQPRVGAPGQEVPASCGAADAAEIGVSARAARAAGQGATMSRSMCGRRVADARRWSERALAEGELPFVTGVARTEWVVQCVWDERKGASVDALLVGPSWLLREGGGRGLYTLLERHAKGAHRERGDSLGRYTGLVVAGPYADNESAGARQAGAEAARAGARHLLWVREAGQGWLLVDGT